MKRFFKRGLAAFLAVSMFMTSSGMTSLAAEVAEHVTNSEVTESGTTEVQSEATEETPGGGTEGSEITTPSDNSESNHIPQEGGEESSEEGSDQEGSDGEEGSLTPDSSEIPAEGSGEGAQEEGEGSHEGGSQESTEEGTETGAEDGEGSEEGTNGDKPAASEEGSGAGETPAEGTEEEPGSEEGAGSEGEETEEDDTEESQEAGTGASQEGGASGGSSSGGTQADTPINGGSADNTLKEDDNAQEEIKEQEPEDEEAASEPEPVSYIIEEISFTDAEIRASKAQRESLQYKSALEEGEGSFGIGRFGLKPKAANAIAPLSLDTEEEAEETETHAPEKEEDTAGYMIERHIDVDDGIEDIKLPDKLVIKLRTAEGEEDHTASKSSATASKSSAHVTAETKAAGKAKTLTVEIPEESWLIMSPEDKAGATIAELDTSGVELLDENGEPTGEFSTEQANYPQYILVPDVDNIDIEGSLAEEGSETGFIDMDQMLEKSDAATLEDYLLKNTAVRLRVGTRANDELIDGVAKIALNALQENGNFYTYTNGVLTLKGANSFSLYVDIDISDQSVPSININFDTDELEDKNIKLEIDGASASNRIISISAKNNATPAIDLSNVESLTLAITGNVNITGKNATEAIRVPEGSDLSINGGNLSVTAGYNAVAIGVMTGTMGDVSISGTVEVNGGQGGVGIGSYDADAALDKVNLSIGGGTVTISGGTQGVTYPLQGINMDVSANSKLLVYSENSNNNDSLKATESSYLLRGTFSDPMSSGVDITITEDGIDVKTINIDSSFIGFMTNVNKPGTYQLSGIQADGRDIGYIGKSSETPEDYTGDFIVNGGCDVTYNNIKSTVLPVFWDHEVKISGELTDSGSLNIIMSAAVDIEEERSLINTGKYNTGTEDIEEWGFYVYQKDDNGNILEDTREEFTTTAAEKGYYSITAASGDKDTFIAGETYYVVPFVKTNAGIREAEDYRVGGNDGTPVQIIENPEIKVEMPVIEFPELISFTYGTRTGGAFRTAGNQFNDNATAQSGKTVTIDGVTFTFSTDLSDPDKTVIWGTNVDDASFRLTKPGGAVLDGVAQDGDWSDVTITVPGGANNYIYDVSGDDLNDYFMIEFVAPSQTDATYGQLRYNNIKKPVKVQVIPRELTLTSIGESGTKVYDGNNKIVWQENSDIEFGEGQVVTPYIYDPAGAQQGEKDTVSIAIDPSAPGTGDAAAGTYDDAEAGDGKRLNISNIHLTGEDSGNYSIEGTAVLDNGNIMGKDITVRPKGYTLRTGEAVTAAAPNGNLEIEVVKGDAVGPEDLKFDNKDFDTNLVDTSVASKDGYTVKLNKDTFDGKNTNYDISYEDGIYKVIQDKPEKDGEGHGAYTVYSDDSQIVNGWYNADVTFAPKTSGLAELEPGEANYYDTIRNAVDNGDGYAQSFTISETSDVAVQLRSSTKLGYTSIETPAETYYVDKVDPVIGEISYSYGDDPTVFAAALRLLSFGSFDNRDVTVTVNASDNASGLWYIEVTGLGQTAQKVYFNNEVETEDIPEPDQITDEHKTSAVQFIIPMDFAGNVSIKAVDHAGNDSAAKYVGNNEGNNEGYWVITEEAPKIEGIGLSGSTNKSDAELWYNAETSGMTASAKAVISDITEADAPHTGLQKIEIYTSDSGKGDEELETTIKAAADGTYFKDQLAESYAFESGLKETADGYIKIAAYNNAGNKSEAEITYKYDATDPVINVADGDIEFFIDEGGIPVVADIINWFKFGYFAKNTLKVRIPADKVEDNLSGVASIKYGIVSDENADKDKLTDDAVKMPGDDGAEYWELTLPVNKTSGYVRYYAVDVAGNTSAVKVLGYDEHGAKVWIVENEAPEAAVSYMKQDGSGEAASKTVNIGGNEETWYTEPVKVTATVTDDPETGYSGLNRIIYTFGDEAGQQTQYIVMDKGSAEDTPKKQDEVSEIISAEGKDQPIKLDAYDNAQNSMSEQGKAVNENINIDLNAPDITNINRAPEYAADTFIKRPINVTFDVNDSMSGIADVKLVRVKDGLGAGINNEEITLVESGKTTNTCSYSGIISENGTYQIIAVDNVGHTNTPKELSNGGFGGTEFVISDIDTLDPDGLDIKIDENKNGFNGTAFTNDSLILEVSASDPVENEDSARSGIATISIYNTYGGKEELLDTYTWVNDALSVQEITRTFNTGTYKLKLVVADKAGNESIWEADNWFRVENTVPKLIYTSDPSWVEQDQIVGSEDTTAWLALDSLKLTFTTDPVDDVYVIVSNDDTYYMAASGEAAALGTVVKGETEELIKNDDGSYSYIFKEGVTELWVQAYNSAGSKYSNEYHFTVKLDNKVPGSPAIRLNNADIKEWYNIADGLPSIDISVPQHAEDTAPETTYYKVWKDSIEITSGWTALDGVEPQLSGDGNYRITAYTVDSAVEADGDIVHWSDEPDTVEFGIDLELPTLAGITVTPSSTWLEELPLIGGWFTNDDLTVTVTVNDTVSGVNKLSYTITGEKGNTSGEAKEEADGQPGTKKFSFTVSPDTVAAQVKLTAVDVAGNEKEERLTQGESGIWTVENDPPEFGIPVFTADGEGTPSQSEDHSGDGTQWYTDKLNISLSVKDEDSGLNKLTLNISKDGVSQEKELISEPQGKDLPYTYDNGGETFGDGMYELSMTATDNSGNSAPFGPLEFNIDSTGPDIDVSDADGKFDSWQTSEQRLSFKVSDSMSGLYIEEGDGVVAPVSLTKDGTPVAGFKPSGNEGADGSYEFSFTTEGNGTYTVTAWDNAGNMTEKEFDIKNIDTEAPEVPGLSIERKAGDTAEGNWYQITPNVGITLSAGLTAEEMATGQAPVYTYYYVWEEGAEGVSSVDDIRDIPEADRTEVTDADLTDGVLTADPFDGDGKWHIAVWAQDEAGNITWNDSLSQSVYLDTEAPNFGSIAHDPADATREEVIVTAEISSGTSGINESGITITKDGDDVTSEAKVIITEEPAGSGNYKISFTAPGNGEYKITVKDEAGHESVSEAHVVDNIADAEVPKPVIKVGGAGVEEGWYFGTEDTTLTIEKADDQSDTVTNRTVYTVNKDRVEIYSGELPDNESSSTIFEEKLGDGVWQVEAYTTRTVDGKVEESEPVTAEIKVDRTSPDIVYVSGNPADWTASDKEIIVSITDKVSSASGMDIGRISVTGPNPDGSDAGSTGHEYEVTAGEAEGQFIFTAEANGTYTITAEDEAGNAASETVAVTRIDKSPAKPAGVSIVPSDGTGSAVADTDGQHWYIETKGDGTPDIAINITEPEQPANGADPNVTDKSPIKTYYTLERKESAEDDWPQDKTVINLTDGQPSITESGVYKLTVWTWTEAAENDGNEAARNYYDRNSKRNEFDIYVDIDAPGVNTAVAEPAYTGGIAKVINMLTFGNFFNEAIKVTVTASEANSGAKILYYLVSTDDGDIIRDTAGIRPTSFNGDTASFDIGLEEFSGTNMYYIKLLVEDAAGNVSDTYLVKGQDENGDPLSAEWMLENSQLAIDISTAGYGISSAAQPKQDAEGQTWYNRDVTVKAEVTNAASGLFDVYVTHNGDDNKAYYDTGLGKDETANDRVTAVKVDDTISAEGTTVFDIYAKDNAGNEKHLSTDDNNLAWNDVSERTVRIDRTAPEVKNVTRMPDKWLSTKSLTLYFTVQDQHDAGESRGTDYSGVNLNPGTDETYPIRIAKLTDDGSIAGYISILDRDYDTPDYVPENEEAENYYVYKATVTKNGTYRIFAADYAGNENHIDVEVSWIPTGEEPSKPVDRTYDPSADIKNGYVTYEPSEGQGNVAFTVTGTGRSYRWYTEVPSSISITNASNFTVNAGDHNTDPMVTRYALVNISENPGFDPNKIRYEDVGYDTHAGSQTPDPRSVQIEDTITGDGRWVLYVKNHNENSSVGNVQDSELLRIPFFTDTTKPVIELAEEDSADWDVTKDISFKVSDPDDKGEQSGIDTATIKVTYSDGNGFTSEISHSAVDEIAGEYKFTAEKRGTYTVTVSDKAGNEAVAEEITVSHISDELPGLADISLDPPEGNGETVEGRDYSDASSQKWYRIDETSGAASDPRFSLAEPDKADADAAPITTYWKIWNGSLDVEPAGDTVDNIHVFSGKGAISDISRLTAADGQWNIKTWSVSASGVSSLNAADEDDRCSIETIFVDNTKPEVKAEPISIEVKNEGSVWQLLNKLTFGVFFNKALEVTVEVKDATSLGEKLYYEITMADGSTDTGYADIDLRDDRLTGTATFELPLDTKGEVYLTAYDKAGNISDRINLTFENGIVYWELEDDAPSIIDTNPAENADTVNIANLDSIWLVFNERVELADGSRIILTVDGHHYTVQDEDAVRIITRSDSSDDGFDPTDEATEGNIHNSWYVEIPVDSFKGPEGEPVELVAGALHQIVIEGAPFSDDMDPADKVGAFRDTAGNANNSYTFYFTADEYEYPPEIGDINITLPEGTVMSPEDFSSDHNDYVLLFLDEAMSADGSQLAEDLDMFVELINNTTHISDVKLTDIFGNEIAGYDDLWTETGKTTGKVTIPAEDIKASENYFVKITATQYGVTNTYSFFISTSAISAVAEDVGDIGVSVDTDELIESMRDRLETDAIRDWKVVIKFRAAAIPVSSAGAELEAVIKALEAAGINDSSLGFQPMDLSVTEYHGRTGETEAIAKLDKPITVTIAMPEDSEGREIYGIYRYDEATGTAVKVEHTLSADGKTAVIVTADFSGTYAIVYDDKPASTGGSGGSGGSGGGGGGGGGTGGSGTLTVSGTTAYYGGTWVNDGWLFKEADGRVPQNEWLRIDGKIYRFGLDGFMDPDYNGYRYNTDGSLAVALPEGQTARDAVGTWLQDGWRYVITGTNNLSNGWYYLFYQGRFEWYYFNAEGWMLDGWRDLNGETYYLHTVHDWTRGRMYTDWHFIDGKWYYFRTKAEGNEGALVRNQYTITGHFVGADGAWDGNGPAPTEAQ